MYDLGLLQCNQYTNIKGNVLDLIFSNCSVNNVSLEVENLVNVDEHHPVLNISLEFINKNSINLKYLSDYKYDKFDFYNSNYNMINEKISLMNWDDLFKEKNINEDIEIFYKTLFEIIDEFTPKKVVKFSPFPKWFDKEIINLIKKKKKLHKIYKIFGDINSYRNFAELRTLCKNKAKEKYKNYISRIENNISTNSKFFWNYISDNKRNRDFPKIMKYKNEIGTDSYKIANLFSKYFSDVYKSSFNPINFINQNAIDHMSEFSGNELKLEDIVKSIGKMNSNSSVGPDGIPGNFIINCKGTIVDPLHKLFNLALKNFVFPDFWKLS